MILTGIFVVSIKSFNTLESFRINGHIYNLEKVWRYTIWTYALSNRKQFGACFRNGVNQSIWLSKPPIGENSSSILSFPIDQKTISIFLDKRSFFFLFRITLKRYEDIQYELMHLVTENSSKNLPHNSDRFEEKFPSFWTYNGIYK